jgi:hypothetical protein
MLDAQQDWQQREEGYGSQNSFPACGLDKREELCCTTPYRQKRSHAMGKEMYLFGNGLDMFFSVGFLGGRGTGAPFHHSEA